MPLRGLATVGKETWHSTRHENSPQWRNKLLTPAQILVNDIRTERIRKSAGPRLEVIERSSWSLVPDDATTHRYPGGARASSAADNPIEAQKFSRLEGEYGWIRHFRLQEYQIEDEPSETSAKCRWIHCSSKFEEYLGAFLWTLSEDEKTVARSMRQLDSAMQQHSRFSKHGKLFSPFSMSLLSSPDGSESVYPMLVSVPFLDWSVLGSTPPLRFQVDRREGLRSTKSSAHLLRSVLQYFYRLEDTDDREGSQVFARYKPWSTNRDLDLKVRQWYGHYPTALNVDELWILAVDAKHIVTFSSNQTWKSRSPPLQLTSRISDISFRGIRNAHFNSEQVDDYTALIHAIVCLNGAVGMMHRNFWADFILPATDRYAGYLSHLQYRLHRSPSTKLVMDLIACQEELNIVIHITEQQLEMVSQLQNKFHRKGGDAEQEEHWIAASSDASYKLPAKLLEPTRQLLDNLTRELTDLRDLRDNTDRLVTRTIQLVNIRLEDHGKAILVFTVVTIVFLPLNFLCSYFGMNFRDIRDTQQTQWLFWAVASCVTAGVAGGSVFLAFSGGNIWDKFVVWRDRQKELRLSSTTISKQRDRSGDVGFRVLGMTDRTASFEP